ncbi:imidazolonepropionase [Pseudooceanicola aestuarii]|uniref:imidazolonepropionase n=1 Tax=Pseudooceanicola aestuarii TaxID=2697319 RepID=UPI0019530444|nr:imidazolonepropionase [Pseudooceanicola aestuarii]
MSDRTIWANARLPWPVGTQTVTDIATEAGRILASGPDLPRAGARVHDCGGRLVTAAPIDCHSHIVHGGDRTGEFEMRLNGASYAEIAQAGGGIVSSMRATRAMDVADLVRTALPRVDTLLAEGCSTIEIKSGYGLSIDSELNMLRAARRIAEIRPVRVRTTWLAAHAMPPDFDGSRADYIADVAIRGLQIAHDEGLVDAVDAFCEGIAFAPTEIVPLFDRARQLGLPVKLHTEQLTRSGGSVMAARFGALSVDHMEYAEAEDIAAIARSGSVAVILPGAFYMLGETRKPPVAGFRAAGVPMALATDCNPGTSPVTSLLLCMNMAAVLFGMTVRECLDGVTLNAARALGLEARIGGIAPGLAADLAIWDVERPAQLVGRAGHNPLHQRVFGGEITHG